MVSTLERKSKVLYDQYLTTSKVRYLAPESRYRYLRLVNSFLMYTSGELDRDTLLYFMSTLEEHSASYQKWAYQVLKGFYEVTLGKDSWPLHPRELPPSVEPKRPYLETDEAEQLLSLARPDPLDYAIFRLGLVTGIRKREIRELNLSDYNSPRLAVDTRKHGERRVRTLDVETVNALDDYIAGPRMFWDGKYKGRDAPLFLSPTGNRMADSTLGKRFGTYMRSIGKPKGTGLHSLRRTVVTFEAEGGMTDMELQKLHGWKSNKMPAIYARLKPAKLEKQAYEANPLIGGGK